MLSLVIVIGIVIVIFIMTFIYRKGLERNGLVYCPLDPNTTITIPAKWEGGSGDLIIYRSSRDQPINEVYSEALKAINCEGCLPIRIRQEPGYNAFRVYKKQREWLRTAVSTWRMSPLHLMQMPIELTLRSMVLPIWILSDLMDHSTSLAVHLRALNGSLPTSESLSDAPFGTLVECYGGVYIVPYQGGCYVELMK